MGLLRLLLALCVFCGHSRGLGGLSWLAANIAVECFFVISGFYMQLILSSKYTRHRLGPAHQPPEDFIPTQKSGADDLADRGIRPHRVPATG